MNRLIARLSPLGVPGLIYFVAVTHAGLLGGGIIVALVAILGGPIGTIGAIGLASTAALIKGTVKALGFKRVFRALVTALEEDGTSRDEIRSRVNKYPISGLLKKTVNEELEKMG